MPDYQFIHNTIKETINDQGHELIIRHLTNSDAIRKLKDRSVDGDCGRVGIFNDRFNLDLIKVEPAFRVALLGIWTTVNTSPGSQPSTQTSNLKIGYVESATVLTTLAKESGYKQLSGYTTTSDMIDALKRGEINSIVSYEAAVRPLKQTFNLTKVKQLALLPVYLHLQPQWAHLQTPLSKAIRARKRTAPYQVNENTPLPTTGNREILFGCSVSRNSNIFKQAEQFYREVFGGLGYKLTLVALPRAREIAELNKGALDGTCGRSGHPAFVGNPNLIKLNTPIATLTYEILATEPHATIRHFNEIPKDKRIAYVRGSPTADHILAEHPTENRIMVTNVSIGIKMLAAKRIDYFLDIYESYSEILESENISTTFYRISDFEPTALYPYINKRHSTLSHLIEQSIDNTFSRSGGEHNLLRREKSGQAH